MKPATVRVAFLSGKAMYRVFPCSSAAGKCSSGEYKGQCAAAARIGREMRTFTEFSQLRPRESFV
jgi:hypothetical protein